MGEFGRVLAMLNPVGQNAEHEGLDLGDGLFARRAVSEGPGNTGHLGEPPAIGLLFDFNTHGETGNRRPPNGKEAFGRAGGKDGPAFAEAPARQEAGKRGGCGRRGIWDSGNQEGEIFTEGRRGFGVVTAIVLSPSYRVEAQRGRVDFSKTLLDFGNLAAISSLFPFLDYSQCRFFRYSSALG